MPESQETGNQALMKQAVLYLYEVWGEVTRIKSRWGIEGEKSVAGTTRYFGQYLGPPHICPSHSNLPGKNGPNDDADGSRIGPDWHFARCHGPSNTCACAVASLFSTTVRLPCHTTFPPPPLSTTYLFSSRSLARSLTLLQIFLLPSHLWPSQTVSLSLRIICCRSWLKHHIRQDAIDFRPICVHIMRR